MAVQSSPMEIIVYHTERQARRQFLAVFLMVLAVFKLQNMFIWKKDKTKDAWYSLMFDVL